MRPKQESSFQAIKESATLSKKSIAIIIFSLIIVFLPIFAGLYLDYLWFKNLNLSEVFLKIFYTQTILVVSVFFIFFVIQAANILFANKEQKVTRKHVIKQSLSSKTLFIIIGSIAAVFAYGFKNSWKTVLLYINQTPFGTTDPIFGKDIAFFVFTLPFIQLVLKFLIAAIISAFIISGIIYLLRNHISFMNITNDPGVLGAPIETRQFSFSYKATRRAKVHLSFLGSLVFILIAAYYFIKRYAVLNSPRGIITGAGYTDVNVTLPILMFLVILSIVIAIELFVWPSILKKKNIIPITIITFLAVVFIALSVIPGMIQYFKVLPNELTLERPFIDNNIRLTRTAYGLDNIQELSYDFHELSNASSDMLKSKATRSTFDNIRLWDHRPLKQTYNQLQEIRLYYDFNDVDVDRYTIGNNYSEVMLSARELNQNQLPQAAQTWVNKKLIFTHGMGVTLSPVNRFTSEGLPELMVKDIPPQASYDSLKIDQPRIYYGEGNLDYVITNTATAEFDYPQGDKNTYTHYQGKGGVRVNSFWRKLLFAIRFGDLKILLTSDVSPESKVLFYRNIKGRISKIAPFLLQDPDPYITISEGKLFWMMDTYTYSDAFPYSEYTWLDDFFKINYIRNSVKVVIDAFDGNPTFYITDDKDPIINTYKKIFPEMFRDFNEMPKDLKAHVRYPEELFNIQANMYRIYHMKDPKVFYNKEDKWSIPDEVYGEGKEIKMKPYYIIMTLPGENKEEFILMTPFTPSNKDNMIGWLAARSDDDYGKLVVYKFPKEKLIYGPMQIEARIDQDAKISEQLTLWGQRGSTVIRGNLLVIPIDHSLIYVEPLYIIAEKTQLPELKRIIISDGKQVVMEKDFNTAVQKLFGTRISTEEGATGSGTQETGSVAGEDENKKSIPKSLVRQAQEYYDKIEESMKAGDWAGIGANLDKLKEVLNQLDEQSR